MIHGVKTIIYPVKDLARAKKVYSALLGAIEPSMDQPYYVGFNVGGQDIGLDPNGHSQGMTGPLAYFQGRRRQRHRAHPASLTAPVCDLSGVPGLVESARWDPAGWWSAGAG